MPLLWALRDELGLVGTKFGCGAGLCGACTVLVDGEAIRSCQTPVGAVDGKIGPRPSRALGDKALHAVQKAWIEADAPQCGYCQSGQVLAAVALLAKNPNPSDADIDSGHDQHLPLRDLSAHAGGRSSRRRTHEDLTEARHDASAVFTRRAFVRAGSHRRRRPRRRRVRSRIGRRRGRRSSGEPWGSDAGVGAEVGAFVVVEPDNSVTLRVAKSEMGQGVLTSLAMILAEELMCDFSRVQVEYASAHRNLVENNVYQSMGTGGSSSVRRSRVFLQQAGASARERLIAAAAARWGVAPAACVAGGRDRAP